MNVIPNNVPTSKQQHTTDKGTLGKHAVANGDVTSLINRAAILGFFADAYFLTSAGHRRIFSTLNHVVKVMQQTPAGRCWETVRPPPDSLCRWQNFRPMSRRRSAGAPAVTAGTPVGRRQTTINPTIIGRSPFGHRAAIYGFAMGEILKWT